MRKILLITLLLLAFSCCIGNAFAESIKDFHNKHISDNQSLLRKTAKKELISYYKTNEMDHMIRYKILLTFIYAGSENKIDQRIQTLNWLENHAGDNDEIRIIAAYHLAYLFDFQGSSKIALIYAKKALSYSKKQDFLYPESLSLIANTYYKLNNFERASYYFKLAYKEELNSPPAIVTSHLNNIALCETKKGNLRKSCLYFQKAMQVISKYKSSSGKFMYYVVSGNLGSSYYLMGEYSKAKHLLENELTYFLFNEQQKNNLVSPLTQLLDIYYREHNIQKQDKIIQQLLHSSYINEPESNFPYYTELIYNHYSRVDNKPKKEYFGELLVRKIKLYNAENSKRQQQSTDILFEEKVNYLNGEILNQKLLFDETKQKEQLYLLMFILVFLFSLSGMYLMRKLHLNKQKLTLQDNLLKEEKIASMALSMSIKSDTEKAFLDKLNEIKRKKTTDTISVLRELQLIVNNILSIDRKILGETTNLTDYDLQFKMLLKNKHPNLNDIELQMCGYFRLRLTSKQIAAVFDTSDGAIRVHKNKIKRKLQLESELSVEEYLINLKN